MKPFLLTTGTVFGLITIAHILRVIDEGTHLLADPVWVALTIVAAGLCGWSIVLLRSLRIGR